MAPRSRDVARKVLGVQSSRALPQKEYYHAWRALNRLVKAGFASNDEGLYTGLGSAEDEVDGRKLGDRGACDTGKCEYVALRIRLRECGGQCSPSDTHTSPFRRTFRVCTHTALAQTRNDAVRSAARVSAGRNRRKCAPAPRQQPEPPPVPGGAPGTHGAPGWGSGRPICRGWSPPLVETESCVAPVGHPGVATRQTD